MNRCTPGQQGSATTATTSTSQGQPGVDKAPIILSLAMSSQYSVNMDVILRCLVLVLTTLVAFTAGSATTATTSTSQGQPGVDKAPIILSLAMSSQYSVNMDVILRCLVLVLTTLVAFTAGSATTATTSTSQGQPGVDKAPIILSLAMSSQYSVNMDVILSCLVLVLTTLVAFTAGSATTATTSTSQGQPGVDKAPIILSLAMSSQYSVNMDVILRCLVLVLTTLVAFTAGSATTATTSTSQDSQPGVDKAPIILSLAMSSQYSVNMDVILRCLVLVLTTLVAFTAGSATTATTSTSQETQYCKILRWFIADASAALT
ncbi:hypothetical protein J6590_103604 [Homalodisca vitripennis]|nr:hypothetical protein J6590_103604 [Homalodisca vitripennis]